MAQRNTEVAPERRILFRIGINLGDVVAEGDDLLGDGVNVAAQLEGIVKPGVICLSRAAYEQARGKIDLAARDLEEQRLRNIAELDLLRISQRIAGEDDRSPLSVLKRPQPAIVALGEEVRTPQTVRRPGTHYQNGWCSCGLNHLTRVHRVRRDGC